MHKNIKAKLSILLLLSGLSLRAADGREIRAVGITKELAGELSGQDWSNKVISVSAVGATTILGPDGKYTIQPGFTERIIRDMTPEEMAAQKYQMERLREERVRQREQIEQEAKRRQERADGHATIIVGGKGTPFEGSVFQNVNVSACSNPWEEEDSNTIRVALNFQTGERRIMQGPNDLRPGEFKNAEYCGRTIEEVMREEGIELNTGANIKKEN